MGVKIWDNKDLVRAYNKGIDDSKNEIQYVDDNLNNGTVNILGALKRLENLKKKCVKSENCDISEENDG